MEVVDLVFDYHDAESGMRCSWVKPMTPDGAAFLIEEDIIRLKEGRPVLEFIGEEVLLPVHVRHGQQVLAIGRKILCRMAHEAGLSWESD